MLSKYEKSLVLYFCIFAIVAGLFVYSYQRNNNQVAQKEIDRQSRLTEIRENLDNENFEAKAVSVFDITKNEYIYSKNDQIPLPFASLVKTMTISVALEYLPEENIIEISPEAITQEGDNGLLKKEKWKLVDLAKLSLVSSSNDGAFMIAKSVPNILLKMNQEAKKFGMKNTVFLNPTGLDINESNAGAYGSARDANILAINSLISNPEIFSATVLNEIILKSESGFIHKVENTNTIVYMIPKLLFSKTGYTALAGGNLSVIFMNKDNHKIAATVLGSTKEGRFSDMEKIITVLYNQDYGSQN